MNFFFANFNSFSLLINFLSFFMKNLNSLLLLSYLDESPFFTLLLQCNISISLNCSTLCFQGIHIQCGDLDFDRPRWKCEFCREVVRNLPNKPVSVFRRVRTATRPNQKGAGGMPPLLGALLEKVTFRVKGGSPLQEANRGSQPPQPNLLQVWCLL
jgi:hypothetical protein